LIYPNKSETYVEMEFYMLTYFSLEIPDDSTARLSIATASEFPKLQNPYTES
jgi:hypothetical protein